MPRRYATISPTTRCSAASRRAVSCSASMSAHSGQRRTCGPVVNVAGDADSTPQIVARDSGCTPSALIGNRSHAWLTSPSVAHDSQRFGASKNSLALCRFVASAMIVAVLQRPSQPHVRAVLAAESVRVGASLTAPPSDDLPALCVEHVAAPDASALRRVSNAIHCVHGSLSVLLAAGWEGPSLVAPVAPVGGLRELLGHLPRLLFGAAPPLAWADHVPALGRLDAPHAPPLLPRRRRRSRLGGGGGQGGTHG